MRSSHGVLLSFITRVLEFCSELPILYRRMHTVIPCCLETSHITRSGARGNTAEQPFDVAYYRHSLSGGGSPQVFSHKISLLPDWLTISQASYFSQQTPLHSIPETMEHSAAIQRPSLFLCSSPPSSRWTDANEVRSRRMPRKPRRDAAASASTSGCPQFDRLPRLPTRTASDVAVAPLSITSCSASPLGPCSKVGELSAGGRVALWQLPELKSISGRTA